MKSSVLIFALTASLQGFYFKKIKLLDTEYSMDIPGDWEVCEQNKESIKYCKDNFFPNLIIIKNYTQRAQELYNLGVNSQKLNKQVFGHAKVNDSYWLDESYTLPSGSKIRLFKLFRDISPKLTLEVTYNLLDQRFSSYVLKKYQASLKSISKD